MRLQARFLTILESWSFQTLKEVGYVKNRSFLPLRRLALYIYLAPRRNIHLNISRIEKRYEILQTATGLKLVYDGYLTKGKTPIG